MPHFVPDTPPQHQQQQTNNDILEETTNADDTTMMDTSMSLLLISPPTKAIQQKSQEGEEERKEDVSSSSRLCSSSSSSSSSSSRNRSTKRKSAKENQPMVSNFQHQHQHKEQGHYRSSKHSSLSSSSLKVSPPSFCSSSSKSSTLFLTQASSNDENHNMNDDNDDNMNDNTNDNTNDNDNYPNKHQPPETATVTELEQIYVQQYHHLIQNIIFKNDHNSNNSNNNIGTVISNKSHTTTKSKSTSKESIDDRISILYSQLETQLDIKELIKSLVTTETEMNSRKNTTGRRRSSNNHHIDDDDTAATNNNIDYNNNIGNDIVNSNRNRNNPSIDSHTAFDLPSPGQSLPHEDDIDNHHHHHHNRRHDHTQLNDSDSTVSSIELVRKSKEKNLSPPLTSSFQSPNPTSSSMMTKGNSKEYRDWRKKRLASTSGKKGTDIQRIKMNHNRDDEYGDDHHGCFQVIDHDNNNETMSFQNNDDEEKYNDFGFQGKDYVDDDDFPQKDLDGITNATMHYDPIKNNNGRDRMSIFDGTLESQSPILRHANSFEQSPPNDNTTITSLSSPFVREPSQPSSLSLELLQPIQNDSKHRHYHHRYHHQDSTSSTPERLSEKKNHHNSNNANDSIESAQSITQNNDESMLSFRNNEDDIYSVEENVQHVDVTLREHSNFYLDPLKVYRPRPKWIVSHDARTKQRMKEDRKKDRYQEKDNNPDNAYTQRRKNVEEAEIIPICTFLDEPFKDFGSRSAERLEVVLDWLLDRDINVHAHNDDIEDDHEGASITIGRGVVISIQIQQIRNLALCVTMKNGVHQTSRELRSRVSKSRSYNTMIESQMLGGTLIIVKSKEDIAEWLCALRERTSCSVLNHAEIPSTERRRVTILPKCVSFDVVLTTYDALKVKEVMTKVNTNGRVIAESNSQGAWLTSKMNNSQNDTHQASKLMCRMHSINWTRVICIDDLGRRSFLTKPKTARMEAVAALKAKSRYVHLASL